MLQEAMAQAFPFMRSFNNARYIGYHKTAVITVLHHTQVGFQGGERIIGYFGFGGRNNRKQGALASIRKTDQTNIGQQLQFQYHPFLTSGFTGLGIIGGLIYRGGEMGIAQPSPATGKQDLFFPITGNFE
jgi:hypothetical protein